MPNETMFNAINFLLKTNQLTIFTMLKVMIDKSREVVVVDGETQRPLTLDETLSFISAGLETIINEIKKEEQLKDE